MELYLYNTLTRRKEPFEPLHPSEVGIYTCGPTVYAEAHIGNLRSYVFPDILKKTLQRLGYRVRHVINITDVGHLTDDADAGEDKMERAARQAHKTAWDIAAHYTALYLRDLERLNVAVPELLPRATEHIAEQIALIERLEAAGYTYSTDDGIYFDTARFAGYGQLARLDVAGLQQGVRVAAGDKRHKTDFALWKFSPPGVQRQMEWDSPWGCGFPGWHIECSAMSMKYLGEQFDIHTGGTDHIPVHHTNEIAQAEAATGHPFVRYWLHGEHLVLGESQRMGKSEGNFVGLQRVIDEGFEPMAYRYLVLNTHYRKYLTFTWEALKAADAALMGLRRLVHAVTPAGERGPAEATPGAEGAPSPALPAEGTPQAALLADLCDDLNTPKALATLHTALRDPQRSAAEKYALAAYAETVLSLQLFDFARVDTGPVEVPEAVRELAEQRWAARQARDFAESDRLRDLIGEHGYVVRDRKDGYDLARA